MENIFYIQKHKTEWISSNKETDSIIARTKTKREAIALTIIHAKTIGNSRLYIYDKDGKQSEERTVKKASRKE
ncbi:MAG: DUF2188 domain-containing protein [Cytophagales bacterium]|nr:MAG: DUF2188 domain-containing protein [Cytophagales bacterium]